MTTAAAADALFALDPSLPLPRFDQRTLLDEARDAAHKDEDDLEAILDELGKLKREVLAGVYQALTALQKQQGAELEEKCKQVVEEEDSQATMKQNLCTFLDRVSSALTGLFGAAYTPSHASASEAPAALQPLMLVNPREASERFDVEKLKQERRKGEEEDLDELDDVLQSISKVFDDLSASMYLAFRSQADTQAADLNNTLSTLQAREAGQERERLAIQTLVERLRAAFDDFP
ncbi:hypothetical protein JCM10213_005725 [Rhodosporidiobolus nylandii]